MVVCEDACACFEVDDATGVVLGNAKNGAYASCVSCSACVYGEESVGGGVYPGGAAGPRELFFCALDGEGECFSTELWHVGVFCGDSEDCRESIVSLLVGGTRVSRCVYFWIVSGHELNS